jgi:hypothetical protein
MYPILFTSVLFAGDTQCALGERCISATEKDPVKVCIKICFYDAHCLGRAQNINSCQIFPVCVPSPLGNIYSFNKGPIIFFNFF